MTNLFPGISEEEKRSSKSNYFNLFNSYWFLFITSIITFIIDSFINFKNPYVNINHSYSAVLGNEKPCQGTDFGYICIFVSDTNIKVETEWKTNEYLKNEIQRK